MPWAARKKEPVETERRVRSLDGSLSWMSMKALISPRGSALEERMGSCVPPGMIRMSKSARSSCASVEGGLADGGLGKIKGG